MDAEDWLPYYTGPLNQDGQAHGRGQYTCPNGSRYEGEFFQNLRHGEGRSFQVAQDCTYEYIGEFSDDCFHGYGQYTCTDGTVYVGYWESNLPNEQGTLTTRDNQVFAGNWTVGELRTNRR